LVWSCLPVNCHHIIALTGHRHVSKTPSLGQFLLGNLEDIKRLEGGVVAPDHEAVEDHLMVVEDGAQPVGLRGLMNQSFGRRAQTRRQRWERTLVWAEIMRFYYPEEDHEA
jgi:hypothetical protein